MRKLYLTLMLSCACSASAYDKSDNLKLLDRSDICTISTAFTSVDGKFDLDIQSTVFKVIGSENISFDNLFDTKNNINCTTNLFFTLEAMKVSSGEYIYVLKYSVTPYKVGIDKLISPNNMVENKIMTVQGVDIWSSEAYGIAPSYSELSNAVSKYARRFFQAFVFDWLRSH